MDVVAVDDPMIDQRLLEEALDPDVRVRTVDPECGDMHEALRGAAGFVVDVNTSVPAELLDETDLRVVARAGVGVDNVDVWAAAEHDVVVTNVPDYCTQEVATHTTALLFACVRRVLQYDRDVKSGGWDWNAVRPVHELAGSTLGFVSFGPIARATAAQMDGFDVEPIAYDPYVDADEMADLGVEKVSFDALLDRTELVVVLAPLTDTTRGLFDADAFDRLPDDAVLVNTGRGGVVVEDALVDALRAGDIAAAGLDVLANEPPDDTPLLDCENAIVTPHAGWYSVEARERLNRSVAENVRAVLDDDDPPNRIDPNRDWV